MQLFFRFIYLSTEKKSKYFLKWELSLGCCFINMKMSYSGGHNAVIETTTNCNHIPSILALAVFDITKSPLKRRKCDTIVLFSEQF